MSNTLLYFKRKNNACYTINIKPELPYNNIINILAKKESILINNLLLIHKGKQIQNIEGLIKLASKSIVHLVDLQQVKNERICVNLRDIHNNQSTRIIDSSTKIANFVRQHLIKIDKTPPFHIGLFYLGKVLNPQKTLAEQLVENNSQLFIINLKDYVRSGKPVTQLQKVEISDQNQIQEIQPLEKIDHRIQMKQAEEVVELKSVPIQIQDIKCQQVKEEQKIQQDQKIQQELEIQQEQKIQHEQKIPQLQKIQQQQKIQQDLEIQQEQKIQHEQKIQQEQKQQGLSDLILQGFKQSPFEEQKQHEKKNTQEEGNLQILIKVAHNEVRNQQKLALQTDQIQVKIQQPNPQQNHIKQQKYIRTQSLQSKQNEHTLQEIMQVSQLPEVTYYNFKIKISQVESHNSESEPHNNVQFDQEDSHSIQSSECNKIQEKQQANQSEKTPKKQEIKSSQFIQPLQLLGQRDILPGDLIFTGADYHNQTVSFIDNLLNQYKGMFE